MRASANRQSPVRNFQLVYLRAVETDEKVEVSFVPRPCTTAMIATEMPAAISPYSMAVAAVSSFRKEYVRFFIVNSISDRDSQIVIDGFNTRARLEQPGNILIAKE